MRTFLFVLLASLLLFGCSKQSSLPAKQDYEIDKAVNLWNLNRVDITYSSREELDGLDMRAPYEIYTVTNPDVLDVLAVTLDNLISTQESLKNVVYQARFFRPGLPPLDMWFSFPNVVWLRAANGQMECWKVMGEFSDYLARELPNVPHIYKGKLDMDPYSQELTLDVFKDVYKLYLAGVDYAKAKNFTGKPVQIIGKPFRKANKNYIKVTKVSELASTKFQGRLYTWVDEKILIIEDTRGRKIMLRLDDAQRLHLGQYLGKEIEITGVLHEADETYSLPNIEIYFYKEL